MNIYCQNAIKATLCPFFGGLLLLGTSFPASAVDWGSVSGKKVELFSPGQASWEWVLTKSSHSTAKSVKKGTNCKECHDGEQEEIGQLIGSGEKIEPDPVSGNPGHILVEVKFAHDNERLYVQLKWEESAQNSSQDPDYQAKVALMFSDGTVKATKIAGCWSACHADLKGMPNAASGKKLTKYLFASRSKISRTGGGDNLKPATDITALRDEGYFLELWRAKMNPGKPAVAIDGYVLDAKHENETPVISAESSFENGQWTVVLSRKLKETGAGYLELVPGKTYQVGFSIHDSHTDERHHHVSFGYTFALDSGRADFIAKNK
jgi:hypothetical protein